MPTASQETIDRVNAEISKIQNKTSDKTVVDLCRWIYEDIQSQ